MFISRNTAGGNVNSVWLNALISFGELFRESEKIILLKTPRKAEYSLQGFCSSAHNQRDVNSFCGVLFPFYPLKTLLVICSEHIGSVSSAAAWKKKRGAEKLEELRKEDK